MKIAIANSATVSFKEAKGINSQRTIIHNDVCAAGGTASNVTVRSGPSRLVAMLSSFSVGESRRPHKGLKMVLLATHQLGVAHQLEEPDFIAMWRHHGEDGPLITRDFNVLPLNVSQWQHFQLAG